ncbi:hypothetical protein [Streptomyces sp. NPDC059092]|uniref:hypothetical protein n=1 Tax=Streptomyces sp. NPDC059092 TaxID=3346725 RepID=UPI0036792AED
MAALAVTLALTVAGCGGGSGDDDDKKADSGSSSQPSGEKSKEQQASPSASTDQVDRNVKLAELKGQGDLVLVVNEAKRDSGGFVTVSGEIKNLGEGTMGVAGWSGSELGIVSANPNSVSGATLVDKAEKKRYFILRDTDNRCLCTTGLTSVPAGTALPVFMQFPAPPEATTEVDFNLPTFATGTLKIS